MEDLIITIYSMILSKEVEIKIVNKLIREYYLNLGYDTSSYKIVVSVKHLLKNSHVLIDVKCDVCGSEKKLKYLKYNRNIGKYNLYTCNNSCAQIKNKMTSMEKYGVEHYSKTIEHKKIASIANKGKKVATFEDRKCIMCGNTFNISIKQKKITCSKQCHVDLMNTTDYKNNIIERTKESLFKKYGVTNQYQRPDIIDKLRKQRIERGLEIPDSELTSWKKYKRDVNKLTKRNKKILFENWDGFDFYDNEFIKNNTILSHLDGKYPTIDHKLSLHYGFNNKISAEVISDIDNLCITKRNLNILKRTKTHIEFISIVNN